MIRYSRPFVNYLRLFDTLWIINYRSNNLSNRTLFLTLSGVSLWFRFRRCIKIYNISMLLSFSSLFLPLLFFFFHTGIQRRNDLRGTIGEKWKDPTRFNSNGRCVGQGRYSFERDGCVHIKRVSPSAQGRYRVLLCHCGTIYLSSEACIPRTPRRKITGHPIVMGCGSVMQPDPFSLFYGNNTLPTLPSLTGRTPFPSLGSLA